MRPKTATCGDRAPHIEHTTSSGRLCRGLTEQEVIAGELWRQVHAWVENERRFGRNLPDGITLVVHPSVINYLMRNLDGSAYTGADIAGPYYGMFPPELPILVTTSVVKDTWQLAMVTSVDEVGGKLS